MSVADTPTITSEAATKKINRHVSATNKGNTERLMSVGEIHRVFEPDLDGQTEVLYTDKEGDCLSAYIKSGSVVWIGSGW